MRFRFIVLLFLLSAVAGRRIRSEDGALQPSESAQHGSGRHTPISNHPSTKKSGNSKSAKNEKKQLHEIAVLSTILPDLKVQNGKSGKPESAADGKRQKQMKLTQSTTISPTLKLSTENPKRSRDEKQRRQRKPVQTISPNLKPSTEKPGKPKSTKDEKQRKEFKPTQTLKLSTPTPKRAKYGERVNQINPTQTTTSPTLKLATPTPKRAKEITRGNQINPTQTTTSPSLKLSTPTPKRGKDVKRGNQINPTQTTTSPSLKLSTPTPKRAKYGKRVNQINPTQTTTSPTLKLATPMPKRAKDRKRVNQINLAQTTTSPAFILSTPTPKRAKDGKTQKQEKSTQTTVPPNLDRPSNGQPDSSNRPPKKKKWYKKWFDAASSYVGKKINRKKPDSTNSAAWGTTPKPQANYEHTRWSFNVKLKLPFCSVGLSRSHSTKKIPDAVEGKNVKVVLKK